MFWNEKYKQQIKALSSEIEFLNKRLSEEGTLELTREKTKLSIKNDELVDENNTLKRKVENCKRIEKSLADDNSDINSLKEYVKELEKQKKRLTDSNDSMKNEIKVLKKKVESEPFISDTTGDTQDIAEFEKKFDCFLSDKGYNKAKISAVKKEGQSGYDKNCLRAIIHIYQQGCSIENIAKIANRTVPIIRSKLVLEGAYVAKPKRFLGGVNVPRKLEFVRKLELLVEADDHLDTFEKMSKVELSRLLDSVQKYIEKKQTEIDKQNLSLRKKDLVSKGTKGTERRLELVNLIVQILNIQSDDIPSLEKATKEELRDFGLKLIELKTS